IAVGNPTPTSFYDAFVTAASQPGSTITQLNGYYKMQDMTADICGAVDIEEDQISLIDVRDNNVYNVAKLKDNRCWMIQNLRFSGTSLDSATSNVDSIYTTSNPLTINWLELKTDSNCYYDGSSGKGWINTCMHKPDVEDLANISSLGYTSEDIGAWYNYAGLTVGTITGASNTAKAQFSICPANWMLPTYIADSGEFSTLKNILSSDPSSFNPIYGGAMINGGYRYPTTKGTWYSSDQAGSQNSFRGGLDYSENSLNFFTASRYDGRYVRCIANNE
ncbi:hypothetical protein IKF89_03320, partial [Candidatus Saccharibacteria bacterium]|nr:hypothetical protein [Candidatus Saccharibacteria bacterium]